MGCGNSVMLVTVLSMTADMIGIDKVRNLEKLALLLHMYTLYCSLKQKKLDSRIWKVIGKHLPC